ncbi:MAG TPA: class C beta-lactamase-related serine hydrolase [Bacteroides sp.]|nr:class C beta-lactamase-related serine hydrolase [Bacteroides sp.]
MKKSVKRVLWILLVALLVFVVWYAWPRAPIITAYAAKGMCSSVFLADKDPGRVYEEDLSFFPISLARCRIDYDEKTVTSRVLGLAKRKAVYREGLGAVLVLDQPEEELKAASFNIPDPGYSQDTLPWPKGDLLPAEKPEGVDYVKLDSVIQNAFDPDGTDPMKKTLGVAVVYDNQLIAEKYKAGYDLHTMFHGWSMTKSIAGTLIGILVDEGKMKVDEPTGIPAWSNDVRKNITVEHILHMSSGLEWVENYFTISEATLMLMRSSDMFSFVVNCEAAHDPGTFWNYSSGDINLLSGLIRNTLNDDEAYHQYPYTRLLHRIGMLNTVIETDASGLFVASSYCYGTTRDWARFGLLLLNKGVFEGDTVVSPEWVEYMQTPAPASEGTYAATFWLKEPDPLNILKDIREEIYFADGFLGQRVYIIPSRKLVVVRMGYSLTNFSLNDFLRDIISTLPEQTGS